MSPKSSRRLFSLRLLPFHPSECFFTASLINGSLDVKVFSDGREPERGPGEENMPSARQSPQHKRKTKKKEKKAKQGESLYMTKYSIG